MAAMAKKRAPARTSTRSHQPVRGHGGKKSSDMPEWKKSKLLAGILMIVIIVCLYFMITGGSGNGSTTIPDDFPRTYLTVDDAGNYDAVLIKRGSKPPEVPIEENGKKYYDAYICLNEKCPGREKTGGKPYLFAIVPPPPAPMPGADGSPPPEGQGPPPEMMGMPELFCPLCKEKYENVKPKYQAQYDPMHIERYQTQEALDMIEKIRQKFLEKNKQ